MSRVERLRERAEAGRKNRNQKPAVEPDDLDVSSIEKASFLQDEQYSSHGNPLHSTALENDCSPELTSQPRTTADRQLAEKGQKKKQDVTETPKRPAHAEKVQSKENQKPSQKIERKSKPRHLKAISENKGEGKKRAESEVSECPGVSPDSASAQSQQRPSLSSEEVTDEDESFHPSKEKSSNVRARRPRSSSGQRKKQKQKRKSFSGSPDGPLHKKQKRGAVKNPIDLDIIVEAFQDFVAQYKETVNSDPVNKAIDALSLSFEDQLGELITASREFSDVKRRVVKINSTLNHRKTKLLEAKNELIKSEDEVRRLQKDHDELEKRLKALRQGNTFLTHLKELNQRYQDYRTAHPAEPETYAPSCMPAMLLDARSIMGTENQLKIINDKLQQVLEENVHK